MEPRTIFEFANFINAYSSALACNKNAIDSLSFTAL